MWASSYDLALVLLSNSLFTFVSIVTHEGWDEWINTLRKAELIKDYAQVKMSSNRSTQCSCYHHDRNIIRTPFNLIGLTPQPSTCPRLTSSLESKQQKTGQRKQTLMALEVEVEDRLVLKRMRRFMKESEDIEKPNRRTSHVSNHSFNINVLEDEECVRYTRFRHPDINKVMNLIGRMEWRTKGDRYCCHPSTATFIMMKNLAFHKHGVHVLSTRAFAMCDVY